MCDGVCGSGEVHQLLEPSTETCGTCGRWYIGLAPAPECEERWEYCNSHSACPAWVPTLLGRGTLPIIRRLDLCHQVELIGYAARESVKDQQAQTIVLLCRTIVTLLGEIEQSEKLLSVYKDAKR